MAMLTKSTVAHATPTRKVVGWLRPVRMPSTSAAADPQQSPGRDGGVRGGSLLHLLLAFSKAQRKPSCAKPLQARAEEQAAKVNRQ